ncbi:TPA: hypothetical protein HA241_01235 [Candidatus Woesearchaeota archaeon]|nr:hypothetical protein [Candidatus Woesearchaeota archaeon]
MMNKNKIAEWILRIGIAGEFLGHGIFALGTKASWLPYFATLGIAENTARILLPLIGIMDITVGISILLFPLRIIVAWAALWGFWTALLRPLAGEPIWDFIERWANWAAPLALLILQGFPRKVKAWIKR